MPWGRGCRAGLLVLVQGRKVTLKGGEGASFGHILEEEHFGRVYSTFKVPEAEVGQCPGKSQEANVDGAE